MEGIHSVALTTDFWTSNNELYGGITGHWTDPDWKLTCVALDCLLVEERHITDNFASFYEQFVAT
jgi:hypothetical protein